MADLIADEEEMVETVRAHGQGVMREFSRFMESVLMRLRTDIISTRGQPEIENDSKKNPKFQKNGKNKAYQTKIYTKKSIGK